MLIGGILRPEANYQKASKRGELQFRSNVSDNVNWLRKVIIGKNREIEGESKQTGGRIVFTASTDGQNVLNKWCW